MSYVTPRDISERKPSEETKIVRALPISVSIRETERHLHETCIRPGPTRPGVKAGAWQLVGHTQPWKNAYVVLHGL